MKRILHLDLREPIVVSVALLLAIVVAVLVGFLVSPKWGAITSALASLALTCLSLATTWSDRNETLRPRVIFYAHREGDDVLLRITNVGLRPAYDVRVTLEKEIRFRLGDRDWSDASASDIRNLVGFLKAPVAFLAPSQTLTSLNSLRTGNERPLPETVLQRFLVPENENNRGTITYRDQNGKCYEDPTVLGFAAFENMKLVTTVTRSSAAKQAEE